MAFYYDSKTGRLEGMPLLAEDANSLTIQTRHFSDSVCLAIPEQKLKDALTAGGIHTGFTPRVDDWQIPNYGSFITPGGNCAGVSISELLYFDQVIAKTNAPNARHLNGLYNGHDALIWQDDNLAFRLVSTVQHDYQMEASIRPPDNNKNLPAEISNILHNDKTVFNAFAFAMMITGQPQLIGVNGHNDQTKKTFNHEMLAYGVTDKGILVNDPNDRAGHLVPFADNELGSFDDSTAVFDDFYYDARGALVPLDKVESRFNELGAGTIGNDNFPTYTLTLTDDKGNKTDLKSYDLNNSLAVNTPKVTIQVSSSRPLTISLYDGNNKSWLAKDSRGNPLLSQTATFNVQGGNNPLGIFIEGDNQVPKPGSYSYVDFKWVNLTYKAPAAATNVYQVVLQFTVTDTFTYKNTSFRDNCSGTTTVSFTSDEFKWPTADKTAYNSQIAVHGTYQYSVTEDYAYNSDGTWQTSPGIGGQASKQGNFLGTISIGAHHDIGASGFYFQGVSEGMYLSAWRDVTRVGVVLMAFPGAPTAQTLEDLFGSSSLGGSVKSRLLNTGGGTINISGSYTTADPTPSYNHAWNYSGTLTLKLVRTE